jgi:hypothetical protein
MSLFKNISVGTTATNVITAAEFQSAPLEFQNRSDKVVTLTATGSTGDTYDMDPWEILRDVPGNVLITATVPTGTATLVVLRAGINSGERLIGESASDPIFTLPTGATAAPTPAGGRGQWSTGQDDFTAVYASATTLTLGTFPTALGTPVSGDFFLVVQTTSTGAQIFYTPNDYAMTLSGQVLTVTGAAFVTGGSADLAYDVFCWGPPREHDASINAAQVRELSPLWARQQNVTVADVSSLADDTYYYPSAAGIDHSGYLYGIVDVLLSCSAGTVTATWEAQAHASATWRDVTQPLFNVANLQASAGSPAGDIWPITVPFVAVGMRLKVVVAGAGGSADVTSYFHGQY